MKSVEPVLEPHEAICTHCGAVMIRSVFKLCSGCVFANPANLKHRPAYDPQRVRELLQTHAENLNRKPGYAINEPGLHYAVRRVEESAGKP